MYTVKWIQADIKGSEGYPEKLNNCHQIIGDPGSVMIPGCGYRQFYPDGLYRTMDATEDEAYGK